MTSGIMRVPPADFAKSSWSITTTASRPTDSSRISITRRAGASMESSTDMLRTLTDPGHAELGLAVALDAEGAGRPRAATTAAWSSVPTKCSPTSSSAA